MSNQPELLAYSIRQACQVSSLSRATLYNHIAAGRLPAVRVGGRRIILASVLRSFLAGGAV